ncbi:MAG: hypothetical protein JXB88_00950 [Spirochaetales bacterium]|nr:hypothetical protein [Spirochaetales bacterium]
MRPYDSAIQDVFQVICEMNNKSQKTVTDDINDAITIIDLSKLFDEFKVENYRVLFLNLEN